MKKLLEPILLFFSLFYFFVRFIDSTWKMSLGVGDEMIFRRDLFNLLNNGYVEALENGISIPFTVLGFLIFKLTGSEILSLRLIPLISSIILFIYIYIRLKNYSSSNKILISILALLFGSSGYLFYGTNDSLFFLGLTIFTIELLESYYNNKINKLFLIISILITISTRPLFLIYLPGLLIIIACLITTERIRVLDIIKITVLSTSFLFLINLPVIPEKISYDNKEFMLPMTWSQRHYLSQIIANTKSNIQITVPLISWDELRAYTLNDSISLPKTTLESIFINPLFTLKEFAKDTFITFLVSTRFIGIATIFPLFYFLRKRNADDRTNNIIVPLAAYIVFCCFSFIIISTVEQRWLFTAFIILIYFYLKETQNSFLPQLSLCISMVVGAIYYFFKNGLFFH